MGSTYHHYRDDCALCGDNFPTRDLNKLFIGASHSSVPAHKTLCKVCDYCLPKLLDFLAVPEPEDKEERPYTPRRWCRKCIRDVGKTANFCPYCGDELATQEPVENILSPPVVKELPTPTTDGMVVILDTRED